MYILRASVASYVPFYRSMTQRSASREGNRCYLSHCTSGLFAQTHTCLPLPSKLILTELQSCELWNWRNYNGFRSQNYKIGHHLSLKQYVCYVGFKTLFCVVRHLDSTASYLPTGLHLGFFRSWPSLYRPSSFSSVFLVLSFVSASTSMLFWVIFLLPFFGLIRTMYT